ncbi:MAG: DUF1800 family protein [Bdellovibrionales bacterium]|nr:DUF1800 family protein [Bdellovibrionales bacterium]
MVKMLNHLRRLYPGIVFAILFPLTVIAGGRSTFTPEGEMFSVETSTVGVLCARESESATYIPVKQLKKRSKVKNLKAVLKRLKETVKSLRDVVGEEKRYKRKRKNFFRLRKAYREAVDLCANGPAPDLAPPTASNITRSGSGLEALAVTLPAESNAPGEAPKCRFTTESDLVSVELLEGCNALLKPLSHRTGTVNLPFVAVRESDGAESTPAILSVSWDQSGSFIGDKFSLARYKDSLTDEEAMTLIRWAGLGANADELRQRAQEPGGLDAVVDWLLTVHSGGACDAVEDRALEESYPVKTVQGTRAFGTVFDEPSSTRRQWTETAATYYLLYQLRESCNPLRERMAMLWLNHFAVNFNIISDRTGYRTHYMKRHMDWLRGVTPEANGKLFTPINKLVAIMHGADGIMLRWLSNYQNVYGLGGGNENYAREVLELFTLGLFDPVTGAQNYTEQHIYDMRFALMGYNDEQSENTIEIGETELSCCNPSCGNSTCIACAALPANEQCQIFPLKETNPMFFRNRWNATNQPTGTFLFQDTPFGQYDVFKANILGPEGDALVNHQPLEFDTAEDNLTPYLMNSVPGVARYFAGRLIATFASLELTESLVQPVAEALIANDWDPTEALRIILSSSAFFAAENQTDGISNPLIRIISFFRLMDLPLERFSSSNDTLNQVKELVWRSGFPMTRMPTVFGVQEPGKIVGGDVKNGLTFAATQADLDANRYFVNYLNELDDAIDQDGITFSWSDLLPQGPNGERPSAEQVVDHFAFKLGIQLTDSQRELLVEYLSSVSNKRITVDGMTVPDPEFIFDLDWSEPSLTDAKFAALWKLKAPGLLQLFWSLSQATLQ